MNLRKTNRAENAAMADERQPDSGTEDLISAKKFYFEPYLL